MAAFIVAAFTSCQQTANHNESASAETSGLKSSLAGLVGNSPLTVGCHSNLVSGTKGGEILYKNGSKITVPANAFETMDGEPVEGEVELQFTEYISQSAIIAEDLPMTYMENDKLELFESAGMFRVLAFQGEQTLRLRPDKHLDITTKGEKQGDFDFFRLENGDWQKVNSEIVSQVGDADEDTPAGPPAMSMDTAALPPKPTKPRKAQSDQLVFDLDISTKGVPELAGFEKLMWQAEDASAAPDWLFRSKWDNARLDRITDETGVYQLTTQDGQNSRSIRIVPAYFGSDYDKAVDEYNKQFASYQSAVEINRQARTSSFTTRTASVTQLGTYNWDLLYKQKGSILVSAEFELPMPEEHAEKRTVHMLTGPEKYVVNFSQGNKNNMRFSPNVENTLIMVGADSSIYFRDVDLSANELRRARRGEKLQFMMRHSGIKVANVAELQEFIDNI